MASDPSTFFIASLLAKWLYLLLPSIPQGPQGITKWKQQPNLTYDQTYHPSQIALFLSVSPHHMTSSMHTHTQRHIHAYTHIQSSGKFTAWFLAALSTGKLHSIRKSIHIPVDCEKEFPLEFDEIPPRIRITLLKTFKTDWTKH